VADALHVTLADRLPVPVCVFVCVIAADDEMDALVVPVALGLELPGVLGEFVFVAVVVTVRVCVLLTEAVIALLDDWDDVAVDSALTEDNCDASIELVTLSVADGVVVSEPVPVLVYDPVEEAEIEAELESVGLALPVEVVDSDSLIDPLPDCDWELEGGEDKLVVTVLLLEAVGSEVLEEEADAVTLLLGDLVPVSEGESVVVGLPLYDSVGECELDIDTDNDMEVVADAELVCVVVGVYVEDSVSELLLLLLGVAVMDVDSDVEADSELVRVYVLDVENVSEGVSEGSIVGVGLALQDAVVDDEADAIKLALEVPDSVFVELSLSDWLEEAESDAVAVFDSEAVLVAVTVALADIEAVDSEVVLPAGEREGVIDVVKVVEGELVPVQLPLKVTV
jgi:hypothetical protein